MLPDILSVISLCLLHETPCNAFLLNIYAICSNITELGSWKDSKPWNGICFSDYRQVSFYTGSISEKPHGNRNSANRTQNSHLKLYFWGVRGLTLILYSVQLCNCIVYNYTTSGHTNLQSVYILYIQYMYICIQYTYNTLQYIYLFIYLFIMQ